MIMDIRTLLSGVVTGLWSAAVGVFKPKPKYEGNIGYEKTDQRPEAAPEHPSQDASGLGESGVQELQDKPSESPYEMASVEEALADENLPIKYKNLIKKLAGGGERVKIDEARLLAIIQSSEEMREVEKRLLKIADGNGMTRFLGYFIQEETLIYQVDERGIMVTIRVIISYLKGSEVMYDELPLSKFILWSDYGA